MRNLFFVVFLMVSMIAGFHCEQDPMMDCNCAPPEEHYSITVQYKKESAAYSCCDKQFRVGFENIMQDSRCPSNVECVWEGTAIIGVSINGDDKNVFPLEIHKPVEKDIMGITWKIEFTELTPVPVSGETIDPSAYVAKIVADKK